MNIEDISIIVAEDEDFQRNITIRILKSLGLKNIFAASCGDSALKIIQEQAGNIDILISDLKMPEMDGMELLRHLSQSDYEISIIIASGLEHSLVSSINVMALAYGISMIGIIEKPINKNKIEALLQKFLLTQGINPIKKRKKSNGSKITKEALEQALDLRQFEPFFQPKIRIRDGAIKGAEALARWQHPSKGIVNPNDFIPPMERYELIDDLTWLILKKSAYLCRYWRESGLNVSISVNLSLMSLTDPDLADKIIDLIFEQTLDPRHIILEITETTTSTYIATALENLSRLRMKGFGLSIDDYGTGYSTMQQLMRIAYTELKIDRSFVTNAAASESARVILSSSLDMARKLSLCSVAEGVETKDDWNYLSELGCDIAQGYLIAKPMPASEFFEWSQNWSHEGLPHLMSL